MTDHANSSFTVTSAEDIRSVRHAIAVQLGAIELGPLRIEDVTVAASELIANAIQHAGPSADVELAIVADSIVVTVTDHHADAGADSDLPLASGGPGWPAIPMADPTRIGGNGLRIVEALSDSWGAAAVPGNGKQVWFRMDR